MQPLRLSSEALEELKPFFRDKSNAALAFSFLIFGDKGRNQLPRYDELASTAWHVMDGTANLGDLHYFTWGQEHFVKEFRCWFLHQDKEDPLGIGLFTAGPANPSPPNFPEAGKIQTRVRAILGVSCQFVV